MTLEVYLRRCANAGLAGRLEVLEAEGVLAAPGIAISSGWITSSSVINQMGFPGYFLIVMEFIAWAKDNAFPVGPGAAPAPAAWWRMRWASPIWIRFATTCCSSAS